MMGYDCFCALCSGPLGLYSIKFGSRRETALARRHKRIASQIERNRTGNAQHEDSEKMKEEEERMDREEEEEAAGGGDEDMLDAGVEEQGAADGVGDDDESEDEGVDDQDGDVVNDGEDVENGWQYEGENEAQSENANENEIEIMNEDMYEEQNEEEHGEHNHDEEDDDSNSWEHDSHVPENFPGCSEIWSQASELELDASFDFYPKESEPPEPYHEKQSYDPSKLQLRDAQWTDCCRILCINSGLKEKKAFISGRGRYGDYSDFRVLKHGNDPRDTGAHSHLCYHAIEPEEQTFGFPMHEACFDVLTRCLGYTHRKDVEKDVMYAVMEQLGDDRGRHLKLDYGPIGGPEQYW